MKRLMLLITCVLLLCGCTVKDSNKGKVSTSVNGISWGFDTPTNEFHVIYEYEDGKSPFIAVCDNIIIGNSDKVVDECNKW